MRHDLYKAALTGLLARAEFPLDEIPAAAKRIATDASRLIAKKREAKPEAADEATEFAHAWNLICGPAGMPRVRIPLSKGRAAKIGTAMQACGATLADWRKAMEACAADPHWCGRNDRGWRGSVESFLRPEHRERWLDHGASGMVGKPAPPPSVYENPSAEGVDCVACGFIAILVDRDGRCTRCGPAGGDA